MSRQQEVTNVAEQPNLWSTLLKESSKRFKAPEATCVFLGNANIGKRTLMAKIGECPGFDLESNSRVIKDIVSYTYMDVDEGLLDSDSLSRINLWSVSDKNFEDCIDKVIKPRKFERVGATARIRSWECGVALYWLDADFISIFSRALHQQLLFMVGVDVSKPDGCIDCLKRLLRSVKAFAFQHDGEEESSTSQINLQRTLL